MFSILYLVIQSEVIAIVTAASGLIGLGISLLSIYQSKKNNESNQKHEDDITILKNSLEIQKSEKDALLDYKYDAKKRLYAEYEPLIFQLHELSESSLRRIRNIAWMARDGKLDPWLSNTENHYIMNTVYRLLAPFVIFKLMQRRLTLFDLNLSPYFYIQYVLVKILYHTFSKDFDHAKLDPKLDYDPNLEGERDPSLRNLTDEQRKMEKRKRREQEPQIYRRQGLVIGLVDIITENLIEYDDHDKIYRIISYGEFTKKLKNNEFKEIFKNIFGLFLRFHPRKCPVLWRILVTQALIHNVLLNINSQSTKKPVVSELFLNLKKEFSQLDWRTAEENDESQNSFFVSYTASVGYLENSIKSETKETK